MCEGDELSGLGNIDPVGDFIRDKERGAATYCMNVILRDAKSARFCSSSVSSSLVSWITVMSRQAVDRLQITRNPKLHIANDTHSEGIFSEMTASIPHKAKSIIPFLSVIIRERNRPESSISSAELYSLYALAAKHCSPLYTGTINVRLLIVYLFWVQVLTVHTTPFFIASILEGREHIMDKLEIHRTSWFNFLHTSGQLRILLSAFEVIKLEPCRVTKLRMPLKDMRSNTQWKNSKRKLDDEEVLGKKRQKSWRRSHQDTDERPREAMKR